MHANSQKAGSVLSGIPRSGQCRDGKTWSSLGWSKNFHHQESPGSGKVTGNCSSTSTFDSIEMTNAPHGMHRTLKEKPGPAIASILFGATPSGSPYYRKKGKSFSVASLSGAFGHSPFEPPGRSAISKPTGFADKRSVPPEKPVRPPRPESPDRSPPLAVRDWNNSSLTRLQGHACHFFATRNIHSMQHPKSANPADIHLHPPEEIWRN